MNKHIGFSLIEVLISLLISSVSLLGLAGLQLNSLKTSDSTSTRSQAVLSSYEILDFMRANRNAALLGTYNIGLSAFADLSQPASGASVAEFDRYSWFRNVDAVLPSMRGAINCNVTAICTMTVQWDDSHAARNEQHDANATSIQQLVYVAQI